MPLVAHTNLPTFQRLREEGQDVLSVETAEHQDIREMHIGLLNMMHAARAAGDGRTGGNNAFDPNLLVDADGLAAVIDWEFAHVGDPCEELGYLCLRDWRFGNDSLRVGGLSKRETFLQAYEGFSNTQIDRHSVDWWEVFGNVRWAAICLNQAERHLSGRESSVELASLGRRSLDMQAEALSLICELEKTKQ